MADTPLFSCKKRCMGVRVGDEHVRACALPRVCPLNPVCLALSSPALVPLMASAAAAIFLTRSSPSGTQSGFAKKEYTVCFCPRTQRKFFKTVNTSTRPYSRIGYIVSKGNNCASRTNLASSCWDTYVPSSLLVSPALDGR